MVLLSGAAGLLFEGETEMRVLRPGDYLLIPAHCRHRVEWTDPAQKTVWLALHYRDSTAEMSGRFENRPYMASGSTGFPACDRTAEGGYSTFFRSPWEERIGVEGPAIGCQGGKLAFSVWCWAILFWTLAQRMLNS